MDTTCTKVKNTQVKGYCVQFLVTVFFLIINSLTLSPQPFTFRQLLSYKPFPQRLVPPLPYTALHFTSFHFTLLFHFTLRGIIINVHRFSRKVPRCSCHIVRKLEFFRQIFENKKSSNNKLQENPSNGSQVLHVDDGRRGLVSLIVAYRNLANASKNRMKYTFRCRLLLPCSAPIHNHYTL